MNESIAHSYWFKIMLLCSIMQRNLLTEMFQHT